MGLDENQANFEDYKARKNGTFIYKDMSPYFNRLDTKSGYKIVLSHFPENFRAMIIALFEITCKYYVKMIFLKLGYSLLPVDLSR